MRVVLGARDTNRRWLPQSINSGQARIIRKALKKEIMLSVDDAHYRQLMAEIKELDAPSEDRLKLAELLTRLPLTPKGTKPPVDIYVEDFAERESSKFLATVESPEFEKIAESRAGSVLPGDDRDEVFDRFFFAYAAAASEVICLDQYLFQNTANRKDGLRWLLQRCINAGVQKLALLSAVSDESELIECEEQLKPRLTRPDFMREQSLPISVEMYGAKHDTAPRRQGGDGQLVHGRHIRFRIGSDRRRTSPLFKVDPGMNAFNFQKSEYEFELQEEPDPHAGESRELKVIRKSPQLVQFDVD